MRLGTSLALLLALSACGDDSSTGNSASDSMTSQATLTATSTGTETATSGTVGSVSEAGSGTTMSGSDTAMTGETDPTGATDPTGETDDPTTSGGDPTCLDQAPAPFDGPTNDACESEPQVGAFDPIVEWSRDSWEVEPSSDQILMTPVVADLDGDATPDIFFVTYTAKQHYGQGILRVMSGDGEKELLNVTDVDTCGHSGLAVGDIDNDGELEIITITTDNAIQALEHDGSLKWKSKPYGAGLVHCGSSPLIADLNADGAPEIISGPVILNADGTERGVGNIGTGYFISTVADLDQDGLQEVLVGNAAYNDKGETIWFNGEADGRAGYADFDEDAVPEIVVSSNGIIRLEDLKGAVLWATPVPGGGGGAPTIADYDGDGAPEIGVAGSEFYVVFDGDGLVLWQTPISETASATGSLVYDFEGDGIADVIHADEDRVWVFSGTDGAVKMEFTGHGSGTQFESPVIADVDGDGQVEIAFGNNQFYGPQNPKGITVIGDEAQSWRPGRRIWNQFSYNITNVNDDGTIPAMPEPNWVNHNNYRSGDLSPPDGKAAPDLKVKATICEYGCSDEQLMLWVQVGNEGASPLTAGATIEILGTQGGEESLITSLPFIDVLPPGKYAEGIGFMIDNPVDYESLRINLVPNEEECAADNNALVLEPPFCGIPG